MAATSGTIRPGADSKLVISYFVGRRNGESAMWFINDLRTRLGNRVQLTSDGHKAYLEAVEGAFEGTSTTPNS